MSEVYQMVTDRIIQALERGTIPWRKPWGGANLAPTNLISQKPYQGINTLLTSLSGFSSPYWVTFNQAKQLGANVRKGEKGTPIVFWKFVREDENQEFRELGENESRTYAFIKHYVGFNVDQLENLNIAYEKLHPRMPQNEFTPIESCERIVSSWLERPRIQHSVSDGAFYAPELDYVSMPQPEQFHSPEEYYSALFHELAHSTGHENRLKRDIRNTYGNHAYSKEELIAETTAGFVSAVAGIEDKTLDNSAAYIQSWLNKLRGDSKLVLSAASQAQKAANMILNVKPEPKEEPK